MFTGLVEEMGKIERISAQGEGKRMRVSARKVLEDMKIGDSIAVNGACLTVTQIDEEGFTTDLSPETLRRTNLGDLSPGDMVNLERPMRLSDRLGGHLVLGHVDEIGLIRSMRGRGESVIMTVQVSPDGMRYVVEKGSVCIDGVSLTIAAIRDGSSFDVALIPHTLKVTTLGLKGPGGRVNVEYDIIGKYVERLLNMKGEDRGGITIDLLREHGFI
ncbi:TPA: riboflavin synthase [Candidatus Poribacteria bacterium]|nr:riboflavin synthase [Candidatus Poribacteria bacterium]